MNSPEDTPPQAPLDTLPAASQRAPEMEAIPNEYDSAAPVTGKIRLEAAWGSTEGDEDLTASETTAPATEGQVFKQQVAPRWPRHDGPAGCLLQERPPV